MALLTNGEQHSFNKAWQRLLKLVGFPNGLAPQLGDILKNATEGTLDVVGDATIEGNLHVEGTSLLGSAVTLSSTLHTVGAATLDSTLDTAGATTLSSTLHTVGAVTLDSTLAVTGVMSPNGGIAAGLVSTSAVATTASLTYYVSTTGSDSDTGLSSGHAFATIQKALDSIPLVVRHACTINVAAGSYAETIRDSHIYQANGNFSVGITVLGGTPTAYSPLSGGSASGTLGNAPGTGITRNVTLGVAWNANELKGKWIKITSGGVTGRFYPIADNGVGSIDVPYNSSLINGATFNVVDLATVITKDGPSSMSVEISNTGNSLSTGGLILQRFKLSSGSTYNVYQTAGTLRLLECYLDVPGSSGVGLGLIGSPAVTEVNRTYIAGISGQIGILLNEAAALWTTAAVINGPSYGIKGGGVMNRIGTAGTGHSVVQGCDTSGMEFAAGGPLLNDSFSNQHWLIRNNTGNGLVVDGLGRFLMQNVEITGNTGHGIYLRNTSSASFAPGHCSLMLNNTLVTGNGGDGIHVESGFNEIQVNGTGSVSTNTGWGLKFTQSSGQSYAHHNNVWIASGVTWSTNTAGSATLDGSTDINVTSLRSGAKLAIDAADTFNRVSLG